ACLDRKRCPRGALGVPSRCAATDSRDARRRSKSRCSPTAHRPLRASLDAGSAELRSCRTIRRTRMPDSTEALHPVPAVYKAARALRAREGHRRSRGHRVRRPGALPRRTCGRCADHRRAWTPRRGADGRRVQGPRRPADAAAHRRALRARGARALATDRSASGVTKELLTLRVNGEPRTVAVEPHHTLLEVLREELGLTGTKHGCELGECGTCTVLVDGVPVLSCLTLPAFLGDADVRTVEGLAGAGAQGAGAPGRGAEREATPDPLQTAFAEEGA